jgi:hypothetical protein
MSLLAEKCENCVTVFYGRKWLIGITRGGAVTMRQTCFPALTNPIWQPFPLTINQQIMSKQSEAKIKQGYVPKAIPQTCANCASLEILPQTSDFSAAGLRCKIGGFAVKKMGTCNEFSGKP